MTNEEIKNISRPLYGRVHITSSAREITPANVREVLDKTRGIHARNEMDIDYLYQYYKGKQPILLRKKQVREEINNRIVENRANEIVSFKVGYLCGEPIQYVSRDSEQGIVDAINVLNDYMDIIDKPALDQETVEWQMIGGTAYRLVLGSDDPECPFKIYNLDPRYTFVVYTDDIFDEPLMGVTFVDHNEDGRIYNVYTKDAFYRVSERTSEIEKIPHALGRVPIFEYPANNARLGAFEIVLPLLDAINSVSSNRVDGLEQTVQAFLKFINCEVSMEQLTQLKELGAIMVKSVEGTSADIDVVKTDVDQNQNQTLKEDLYNAVLNICGLPNRNGGKSTSDTGAAVVLRDGWSLAESRAKDSERMFKRAEKKLLKLVLDILDCEGVSISLKDIDIKFTRRNYENIQTKSQVLCQMLGTGKIHPLLAFAHSGMFSDPESAYAMSQEYAEEQEQKEFEREKQSLEMQRSIETQDEQRSSKNA